MSLISSVSVLTFRMARIILNVDDGRQLATKFAGAARPIASTTKGDLGMPMIDVYATTGTFADRRALAQGLATAVMRWEQVPDLALFRDNTAAFVHELPADSIANVNGESNYVRVQVLTPVGVLDRDKQLGVVKELTEIVAAAAGDPSLSERTWVLLTASPEGGWGVAGHANTGADLAQAARAEMAARAEHQTTGT
jgi:phenylpyruvate tautomerase PptA (4-oxalocrotonate tautomerase family)